MQVLACMHTCEASTAQTSSGVQQMQQCSFGHRSNLYDSEGRLMLKNLAYNYLEEWCLSIGETSRRAMQIWRWLYSDNCWIQELHETIGTQNGFSAAFCLKAGGVASVSGGLDLVQVARARDGTRKMVFKLTEGEGKGGTVETVLIPVVREDTGARPRVTLCVSSQVGCAMNCQFCYTGRMGLAGNLSTAQIVEQMIEARRLMAADGDTMPITNVVFMGMGEPFHNLEAVLNAVDIMCHTKGLQMSHNKVTVSTVGLVDKLDEFVSRSNACLAISLHATTDEVRDWIVPVNRRHNIRALMAGLEKHYQRGNGEGHRLMIEYTMLKRVNDTLDDAHRLVNLIQNIDAKVNLIVFNPHAGTRFQPTPMEDVLAFRGVLVGAGRVCTIRDSRGDDEMAACGQLGYPQLSSKSAPILEPPERFKHVLL
eukprot:jgi/Chrzof1/9943/Cz04g21170.t1